MTLPSNKEQLRQLMSEGNLDNQRLIDLLKKQTKRDYSLRTVQAWLADDGRSSSRPVPVWVLEIVNDVLRKKASPRHSLSS